MTVASHLKSLQALDLALRTGSVKGAADLLGITPAAAGQRIKVLEDYLGFELLTRGRSGLRPTPALADAVAPLAAAFEQLKIVEQRLDFQRTNEIHIAANCDFVELWLMPRLTRYRASYPNISFCVNGEGDAPLRLGQVDCSIAFGEPRTDSGTDVLFGDFLVPISSRDSIDRLAKIGARDKLEGFPLLHLDFYKDDPQAIGWPQWIGVHGYRKKALERGMRFQRVAAALDAVLSRAGLMIGGLALLSDYVDDRRISFPFPLTTGTWTSHAFCATFRAGALIKPPVKRFREWLLAQSAITQRWVEEKVRTSLSPPALSNIKTDRRRRR
ncbi:MAG TPA: LysR family transcriptional regulator [Steroidobacteraceae bacterium]|nr:LysR family transcriptional regulator [Steroidobacteraceae bacterium]